MSSAQPLSDVSNYIEEIQRHWTDFHRDPKITRLRDDISSIRSALVALVNETADQVKTGQTVPLWVKDRDSEIFQTKNAVYMLCSTAPTPYRAPG